MEVLEEVCEKCLGIFSFRDRTPFEMLAFCFLGGFLRLCTFLDLVQMFLSFQRSPLSKLLGKASSTLSFRVVVHPFSSPLVRRSAVTAVVSSPVHSEAKH